MRARDARRRRTGSRVVRWIEARHVHRRARSGRHRRDHALPARAPNRQALGMTPFPTFPATSDLIGWWARLTPERVAIVDRTRNARHTYADLDAAAERWARALSALGVRA